MKNKDNFHQKSSKELKKLLEGLRAEYLHAKLNHKIGKLKDFKQPKKLRKKIAQILTILRKRKLENKDKLQQSQKSLAGSTVKDVKTPSVLPKRQTKKTSSKKVKRIK